MYNALDVILIRDFRCYGQLVRRNSSKCFLSVSGLHANLICLARCSSSEDSGRMSINKLCLSRTASDSFLAVSMTFFSS
jgi:hypothetical protein